MALNSYEIDPLIDALRGHRLGATANDRLLAGQLASQEIAWRRDTHREPAMNGITIITSNHNGNNNNNPFYTEGGPTSANLEIIQGNLHEHVAKVDKALKDTREAQETLDRLRRQFQ
ncbi:hypothetical protein VTN96DRAFT_6607 [Rasamsonia emersonii]